MKLKGSRQPESRGVGNVSNWPNLSRTAAIDVLFSINFDVFFDFIYFRFHPRTAKWKGNVLPNRRNAAIRSMFFSSFIMRIAYWRTESVCVLRQCAANCKKACEILSENYRRCNTVAHCRMGQGALLCHYISAGNDVQNKFKKGNAASNSPHFAYSGGHRLLIFLYWGGNGNT